MSQIRLEKWKIFDSLSDQVKRSIRLAHVFPTFDQNPPSSAIYVTEEDEVFRLGLELNASPYIAVDTIPQPTLTRIDVLCGQNIQGLEINRRGNSIFAISSLGSVFAWGTNDHGQLGLGTNQDTNIPTKIAGILEGKKVVQVACGLYHTLVLTSDGQVSAFGHNHCGQLGLASNARGFGPLTGRFVTAIACQNYTSVALLDFGAVFAWGLNNNGIMAIEMNQQPKTPVQVSGLEGVTISKITCGHGHTLALSTDGKVYSWIENKITSPYKAMIESFLPEIISSAVGRVIDIAAHSDLSAAMSESKQIYVWGLDRNELVLGPKITSLSSLDEVFAPNTFRSLRPNQTFPKTQMITEGANVKNEQLTKKLHDCVKQAFNDLETADFAFIVEGKKIHVHKSILILRCVVFKTMFLGDWKESHENEHTIEGRSFDAFFAFLKYFYTDELDVQLETAIECLCLAHFYQMNELQVECESLIKTGVTVENAALIYDNALLIGSKEFKTFVFDFCLKNLTAVVTSDNFKKLSEQVARDFFQRAAEQGGFKN